MRVVSMLASGTEIVCALGAGERLVGRSHECDNPEWVRSLPACSEPAFDISVSSRAIDAEVGRRIRAREPLYRIHTELIRRLAPDLVIAQEHCDVCAVTPGDLERTPCGVAPARLLALSASSVEGIFQSIRQVAEALDLAPDGDRVIRGERDRFDRLRAATAGRRRPSVVLLEWTDPIYAMGNWGPELIEAAHGEPLLGNPARHSSAMSCDRVREADPEFLVVAPCGFDLERACRDRAVLENYPGWRDVRAVREGKVAFADGNRFFNRSGMTISRSAEMLAEILHGVAMSEPAQGRHWRWLQS